MFKINVKRVSNKILCKLPGNIIMSLINLHFLLRYFIFKISSIFSNTLKRIRKLSISRVNIADISRALSDNPFSMLNHSVICLYRLYIIVHATYVIQDNVYMAWDNFLLWKILALFPQT